jgi:hypothetical protein
VAVTLEEAGLAVSVTFDPPAGTNFDGLIRL